MKCVRFPQVALFGMLVTFATAAFAQQDGPNPDELFKKLDINKDGKLTSDEISGTEARFLKALLRIGDRDNNGELSKQEFLTAFEYRDALPRSERPGFGSGNAGRDPQQRRLFDPKRAFQMMDRNRDGKISVAEVPERAKRLLEALLRRAGKKPDDSLSAEQFVKLLPGGERRRPQPNRRPAGDRDARKQQPNQRGSRDKPSLRRPLFFQKLDVDGDRKISKAELAKAIEKFDELDVNKDGNLDLRELIGAPPGDQAPGGRPGSARPDRRGVPDRPERKQSSRRQDARPRLGDGKFIERVFKRFDTDGDGKLSKDEAPPKLQEHFSKVDANSDGYVDVEELKNGIRKSFRRPPS